MQDGYCCRCSIRTTPRAPQYFSEVPTDVFLQSEEHKMLFSAALQLTASLDSGRLSKYSREERAGSTSWSTNRLPSAAKKDRRMCLNDSHSTPRARRTSTHKTSFSPSTTEPSRAASRSAALLAVEVSAKCGVTTGLAAGCRNEAAASHHRRCSLLSLSPSTMALMSFDIRIAEESTTKLSPSIDTSVTLLLLRSCSALFRRLFPRPGVLMASSVDVDAFSPPSAEDSA